MTAEAWSVADACEEFARTGLPVDPDVLAGIIRLLRKQSAGRHWTPAGRAPSPGPQGGRGADRYEIGQLQRLHAALSPWLTAPDRPVCPKCGTSGCLEDKASAW